MKSRLASLIAASMIIGLGASTPEPWSAGGSPSYPSGGYSPNQRSRLRLGSDRTSARDQTTKKRRRKQAQKSRRINRK